MEYPSTELILTDLQPFMNEIYFKNIIKKSGYQSEVTIVKKGDLPCNYNNNFR